MKRLFLLALLAAGCGASSDPCEGKSGLCIGLHVKGSVTGLDQLSVKIDVAGTSAQLTPSTPKAFSLPVKIALFPPAGTSGNVHITVDGLGGGAILGQGETDATAGGHTQATITLISSNADLAIPSGADLAGLDFAGLDLSTSGTDGGGSMPDIAENPDLVACAGVSACANGDGCCFPGCDNTNDSDCAPVCGNHVVESGESCDDGNTTNGDGCDPTCDWGGIMTTISGTAASFGYADGANARFGSRFGGMGINSTSAYFSDLDTKTIRVQEITGPGLPTTVVGSSYDGRIVDGAFADARLGFGNMYSGDVAYVGANNTVYFTDWDAGNNVMMLRAANLTTQMVSTIDQSIVANPWAISTDGTSVYYLGGSPNDLRVWTPGSGSSSSVATKAAIVTHLGTMSFCYGLVRITSYTYLSCDSAIVVVPDTGGAGSSSLIAGSLSNPGCVGGDSNGISATTATFQGLDKFSIEPGGPIYLTSCNAIYKIQSGNSYLFAGAATTAGYVDDVLLSARFGVNLIYGYDGSSNSFISDGDNGVMRRYHQSSGTIGTIGGTWPGTNSKEVRGDKTTSRFTQVVDLVSDGTSIYALGGGNGTAGAKRTVYTVDIAGGTSTDLAPALPADGKAITKIGSQLYVALDDGTIYRMDLNGTNNAVWAGSPGAKYPPANGVAGDLTTVAMAPIALATDGTDLYFVDSAKLVRKISLGNSSASLVAGTQDSTDVLDQTGGAAHFANPQGMAYANGALYVLDGIKDQNNNIDFPTAIRRVTLPQGVVTTVVGQLDNIGDADGTGAAGQISGAVNLASDGHALFISDAAVNPIYWGKKVAPTIREFDLSNMSLTTMVGTRGQFTLSNGTGTAAIVHGPGPITFDATTHSIVFFDNVEGVFQKIH